MNFQTKIPIHTERYYQIDYESEVLLLGSCFAEEIGQKFEYFKFKSLINPFGILFNPLAIETLVTRAINEDYYRLEDIQNHEGIWSSFDAHSRLNATSENDLLLSLNKAVDDTKRFLENCSHIIITFVTSWVYRHVSTDTIVANCHKVPQKQFIKELLSIDAIQASFDNTITLVRSINPKASFIFTVSPVRHIKDGFVENTLSKAHLIAALHQVVDPRNLSHYFPAYEIVMDELRDYRFYNEDMLHPSSFTVAYIWSQFR